MSSSPHDFTLATSPRTGEFQTCADGVSCTAWHGAGVFESARSDQTWPARSSPSPVVIYTRAVRSVISSDSRWPSLVSSCSRNCLEHFACPCPVITFYCNLLPAAEDILDLTFISGHHHSDITNYVTVEFLMAIAILATLKNSDWLIDWLIDWLNECCQCLDTVVWTTGMASHLCIFLFESPLMDLLWSA